MDCQPRVALSTFLPLLPNFQVRLARAYLSNRFFMSFPFWYFSWEYSRAFQDPDNKTVLHSFLLKARLMESCQRTVISFFFCLTSCQSVLKKPTVPKTWRAPVIILSSGSATTEREPEQIIIKIINKKSKLPPPPLSGMWRYHVDLFCFHRTSERGGRKSFFTFCCSKVCHRIFEAIVKNKVARIVNINCF